MNSKIHLLDNQKIILFGCGGVGKCVLEYLSDFFIFKYENVYVIEKENKEADFPTVKNAINKGVTFIHFEISDSNLDDLFTRILNVKKYDIVIDLSTRTNTFEIFKKVRKYSLFYINTSIEDHRKKDNYIDKSIFSQHVNLRTIDEKLKNYDKVTTLIEYGMNPGLITTFVRHGLNKLSKEVLDFQIKHNCLNNHLYEAYQSKQYNKMAKILGVKVIHCSEIDTQIPDKLDTLDKEVKENHLLNTWSCLGLVDEGTDPLEIILGTHENKDKILEKFSSNSQPLENSNFFEQVLMINKPGSDIKVNSFVPSPNTSSSSPSSSSVDFVKISGRCIHHGESISLNRFLSDDTYSPTIHYVYKLSPLTSDYLDKHSSKDLLDISRTDKWQVMNMFNNHLQGTDNVGALFILEKNPFSEKDDKEDEKENYLYWTGSILDTEYTKNVLGDIHFGPTIIQVMAGVLSGLSYILENDNKEMGLIFGEYIPEQYIISKCEKYLGKFYSGQVNLADNNDKKYIKTAFHELLS